jgi:UDP-N-acetylmuramate--alanine ligase
MENGARVYNDYAHHPSEIKATLSAAKAFGKRVVCIFQPHTYSRTASLFEDFTRAFSDSDITLFADIYAARETDTLGVSSELLAKKTPASMCLSDFESIAKYVNENCTENDLVLILGAGDIVNISKLLV